MRPGASVLCAALLLNPSPSKAQEHLSASAGASKLVALEQDGDVAAAAALRASLESWLTADGIALVETAEQPVARVVVHWTAERCTVQVFDEGGELSLSKLLRRDGASLLLSESAALIAHTAVRELLEARRPPPLRAAPATPPALTAVEPEVAAARDTTPRVESSVEAWVQGRAYDAQAPFVFGGGAGLALGARLGAWSPHGRLLVAYQGPVSRETEVLTVRTQALSARLLGGVTLAVERFSFSLELGGGVDVLFGNATSGVLPARALRSRVDPSGFFTVALSAQWQPSSSTGLFVRALADLDPAPHRYVSVVADERTVVLEPWRFRPSVQLGVSFDLTSLARSGK